MVRRRLPMFVLAASLFGLIVLLATLQYRWLGQISTAERTRIRALLRDNASAFAEDFDRELNRAYLMFQVVPVATDENLASQVGARYDRWMATSQHPRLVHDVYLSAPGESEVSLRRFNTSTRLLEPAAWPAALGAVHARLANPELRQTDKNMLMHSPVQTLWPDAPALVVAAPMLFVNRASAEGRDLAPLARSSYCILLLDSDYIRREMLPALARRHFQSPNGGLDYQLAVVPTEGGAIVYHSASDFNPPVAAKVDASADLFHLRLQDFGPLAAEITRFALFSTDVSAQRGALTARTETVIRRGAGEPLDGTGPPPDGRMSIVVQQKSVDGVMTTTTDSGRGTPANVRFAVSTDAHWRLLVRHPSGSLEQAVDAVRRRNLIVSTGILGVLAVSVGFLFVSTRSAHDLARQQLEFVATVSHELRTPLAVIRSAADNLADGVVSDEARVRQYGQLVRGEGVRLTELVEQILEFAGLQSGQPGAARHPVTIDAVLREAVVTTQAAADAAGVRIELTIDDGLPDVAGDEPALRRVFVNLIGNAVKYGVAGQWVGVRARMTPDGVEIVVSDRGIGIAAADHHRIFDPFYRTPAVVAAQIQGAGLGLSLVKRIVEAHGGRVSVASAPGRGSTFTVALPAMSAGSTSAGGVGAASPQHS
jgi:signal transduction histidine kinase